MSTQHPDFTDDDFDILALGHWNPGEEASAPDQPVTEAGLADAKAPENLAEAEAEAEAELSAPQNPWQEPENAQKYALQENQAVANPEATISRVELQPGGIKAAVEAILAVADNPVSVREFAAALIVSERKVEVALDELYREYNGWDDSETVHEPRGFELRQIAGGWRLYARSDFSAWVARFVMNGQSKKLPKAVMETLAVIAYQQPITKAQVAGVRGASADSAFRQLLQRGLIAETVPDEAGNAQFITTEFMLEKLGLNSLEELPPLAPFLPDLEDIDLVTDNP